MTHRDMDASFGERVKIALNWSLAFAVAWIVIGVPIAVVAYFVFR